jgi:arabinofuranosyltransferase
MEQNHPRKYFVRSIIWRIISLTGLAVIICFYLVSTLKARFIQDDAFTSLRYVKNFINGNGLVFNIGERVEGYTNFLWVIILSVIEKINRTFSLGLLIEDIAQYLSIFFGITIMVLTYLLSNVFIKTQENNAQGEFVNIIYRLLPVFMMSASTPLIYWSSSAMETSLFVFLFLLSVLIHLKSKNEKHNYWFVIISVLNALLRPEGIVFFIIIMSYGLYAEYLKHKDKKIIQRIFNSFNRSIRIELTLFLLPILFYLIFRFIYYGYFLPNTFYAKTEFSYQFIVRGIRYFLDFSKAYLFYGIVLLIPFSLVLLKKVDNRISLFFIIIFTWIVLVILIGGDVLPIHRFFIPVMPLIYILFSLSLIEIISFIVKKSLVRSLSKISIATIIILLLIVNYGNQKEEMMIKRAYESGLVKKMKIYAGWIEEQSRMKNEGEKITVAMSTIGAFSYYSDARVIDLVGLTDSYIAHHPKEVEGINNELPVLWKERRYNAEYTLNQKLDYIIFPAGAKPSAFAECAIFVQPEFINNYYTQIFYSEELNQMLPIFTRRIKPADVIQKKSYDVKFLKHYINASNLFLIMLEQNDKSLLNKIISECDSVTIYSPVHKYDSETIKGMAFYHIGDFDTAEKYLKDVSKGDQLNSIARFYLKNIFVKKGDLGEALNLIIQIKKISPGALPNLDQN